MLPILTSPLLIRRTVETVGRNDDTEMTAFADGCPGLRTVRADARVTKPTDPGLVPYRDAFATHEVGGRKFVDRRR
jgi:hypothetical protein